MRTNIAEKKRPSSIYLNADLLEESKELDLNVSVISYQALEVVVKERKHWIAENRTGIDA